MDAALQLANPLAAHRCVPMDGEVIDTLPEWGWRVDTTRYTAKYTPFGPLEINMRSPMNVIGFTFGRYDGLRAIDSDKARRHVEATANYLSFTPSGCEVRMRTQLNPDYTIIGVSDEYLQSVHDDLYDGGRLRPRYMSGAVHPRITEIGQRFRRWFRFGDAGDITLLDELALHLTAAAIRSLRECDGIPPDYPPLPSNVLQRAVDFVEARLTTKVSVFEIAQTCHMSPYQFSRRFSAAAGLSPHQYVMERRLVKARNQLRHGDAAIADVAYACGFASHAHLTRSFQKALGTTPSVYRSSFRR